MADKAFLALHRLGLIQPFVRYSSRLRSQILAGVKYNTDLITNQLTYIDMVTDSLMHSVLGRTLLCGKGAAEASFITLTDTFRERFGYKHVFPISQGRLAEWVLANARKRRAAIVPNNLLFVTTRCHQELVGSRLAEIPVADAYDLQSDFPFKGNLDTEKLQQVIAEHGAERIPYIYVEACVNASGGHPVSMANLREVHRIARQSGIPVIIDGCRILENAWLIRTREPGYSGRSLRQIVREFCSHSDGCTMSATKDFLVDTGGFVAANDDDLRYELQDALMVVGDGLSVRAKALMNRAVVRGFRRDRWVRRRLEKAEYLWTRLKERGVPVVHPPGGHAVFIDAAELCEQLGQQNHPEKAFLVRLYLDSGILAGENMITPAQKERGIRMIRLALPMRRYSFSQMGYVARHVGDVWGKLDRVRGLRKVHEPPCRSGSFLAEYELT